MRTFKANISLTLVLITGAVLLVSGLTLLYVSMDSARISMDSYNYNLAIINSKSCFEEALHQIKLDSSYTGTLELTFDMGTCSVITSNDPMNPNYKILAIESDVNGYTKQITNTVDISTSPYSTIN